MLQEPKKTLGTLMCPRLEETTLLEPLVCKKITQNRITGIHFMADSVVTTYQEGSLQIWKRPIVSLLVIFAIIHLLFCYTFNISSVCCSSSKRLREGGLLVVDASYPQSSLISWRIIF